MDKRAIEIGQWNAQSAQDQAESYKGEGYSAFAAYLVNTVDSAREEHVSAEIAVQAFLDRITD